MTACTICEHPKRAQIEIALTYGMGAPAIARRFGVSKTRCNRHRPEPSQRGHAGSGAGRLTEAPVASI